MWTEYPFVSGTVAGEVKNEVYNRFGLSAMETAHYGWHHSTINPLTIKSYNLVNSNPCYFLIVTVEYLPITKLLKDFPERLPCIDPDRPSTIHFDWVPSNTDFLTKEELDTQGIPYTL